jgi:hypothetical protein
MCRMDGQVETSLGIRALAARLARAGLCVRVGESCHYEGGRYLDICEGADLTLERVGPGEYLARADADSAGPVHLAASRLSRALADLGIRHRLEIDDGGPELARYLHHLWPRSEGA